MFGSYSFSNYVSSLYLSCILEFPYFLWRLFIAFKTFLLSLRHASVNLVCAGGHVINTAQAAILPVNVPLALKDNSVKLVRKHFAKYVFSSTFDFQKKREKKTQKQANEEINRHNCEPIKLFRDLVQYVNIWFLPYLYGVLNLFFFRRYRMG